MSRFIKILTFNKTQYKGFVFAIICDVAFTFKDATRWITENIDKRIKEMDGLCGEKRFAFLPLTAVQKN